MNTRARFPGWPDSDVFRRDLRHEFDTFLAAEEQRFAPENRLRIDLHCHDRNSDVPDELWGRILGLPETWLKTPELVRCLRDHGSDVVTVTNHNNARSCWELLERGEDVLVGAEFTCFFPEMDLYSHVLTYGFSPAQESVLQRKRQDIYDFLRYTAEHDLPVVLPHPLYLYKRNGRVDPRAFEKFAVLFQRFEVLNGQRDVWQSTLTLNWLRSLSPEKIETWARRHRLNPADFGVDPTAPKVLTGGSDDHMGIFAGQSGSFLEVPDLAQRRLGDADSVLALEALRVGRVAPYGDVGENQKLGIALLDFFAQVANRIEDPGLLRLLMHRGEMRDKVACLVISNVLLELKKQKNSRKFFEFVHAALHGRKPNRMVKWKVPKPYRFCIDYLEAIADSRHAGPEAYVATVNRATSELFTELSRLMIARIQASGVTTNEGRALRFSTEELIQNFEIPAQLSALLFGGENRHAQITGRQLRELMQSLSFPLLVTLVLAGATVASTRLLYQNRAFLNEFAGRIGRNQHAARALHLTDTLFDRNGVSSSLGGKLREIQRNDLPIDLLVCHESAAAEPHLHVLRPLASMSLPDSGGQQLRVPDLMAIARIFYDGGYDRVVCSTEGPMLLVGLFLRYMFNVPAYFFMHSDWIEYIRCNLDITRHERDRVRRLLRLLYGQFDGVFALNSQHRDWLTGQEMQLDPARVHLTAHHAPEPLAPVVPVNRQELFADAGPDTPVLFLASRLSREKGLADLPAILSLAREALPDLRLVIAGAGPEETSLRAALPDACFLGWVDRPRLAQLYAGLDLFVFPSRFDTFGNVLLEAFSYGMPAVAYNCKGPADIIQHAESGWLAEDVEGMAMAIVRHFQATENRQGLRAGARRRAADYSPERIMTRYLQDLGLPGYCCEFDAASVRVVA